MKVVYINSVFGNGSTGSIVRDLHSYCRSIGIESFVIYGRGDKIREPFVYKSSCELLSKINQIRARLTGFVYGGNCIATSRMIRKIKKIKPDIVHIHNLNDQYVNEYRLLKYLAKSNIKVVITLHSEQMYTGTCGHAINCTQFMNGGCKKCDHIYLSTSSKVDRVKYAFKKLEAAYNLFDRNNLFFTSCTPWLKQRGSKSILISRFNNVVIFNGGNDLIFKPIDKDWTEKLKSKYGLPVGKKIILHVNPRPEDPNKGYQYLDELSNTIDEDSVICVVGKIPQSPLNKKNVIHLGRIDSKSDLAYIYACSDLTLVLSNRECFPMVIVESLLCGTPVAGFKCGGPDECFPSNFVSLSDYGDVKELCKNMKCLFKIKRNEISTYAKQSLTTTNMCDSFIQTYNEIK